MATWALVSQLLVVALVSWQVLCFPKVHRRRYPYAGNMEVYAAFDYRSSQGAPAKLSRVSYPAAEEVYSPPGIYAGGSSLTPYTSNVGPRSAAFSLYPVAGSKTAYAASGTSQHEPGVGFPPSHPFQAGELSHYRANLENGNYEQQREESSRRWPPPRPSQLFKAGELSHSSSTFEHGSTQRDTEVMGTLMSFAPSQHRHVSNDPLPSGSWAHPQSNYEAGSDSWDEGYYEKSRNPFLRRQFLDRTKI